MDLLFTRGQGVLATSSKPEFVRNNGNNGKDNRNNRTIVKVSERGGALSGALVDGWSESVVMTSSKNLKLLVFIKNWAEVQIPFGEYENDNPDNLRQRGGVHFLDRC